MSKHTPGPWRDEVINGMHYINSDCGIIGYVSVMQQEMGANAKILSESLNLLDALQELLSAIKHLADDAGDRVDVAIKNAELVIAKATGEG